MARLNIVVPRFHPTRFTGGVWCIMQYADGLARRGHTVNVISLLPSVKPKWFTGSCAILTGTPAAGKKAVVKSLCKTFMMRLKRYARLIPKKSLKSQRQSFFLTYNLSHVHDLPYELNKALSLNYLRNSIPEADITMATSFETALPVALFGKGRKYYFMQHYEPYFKGESRDPFLAEQEARLSYRLGLNMIANSSWLKAKIEREISGTEVDLCLNAINHEVFHGEPKNSRLSDEVKVISYGGRDALWKGFGEMAEAMKIARAALPDKNIRWQVYGTALLPPVNQIASYESLGFLDPKKLSMAYRSADILLSASWYESFPLFPIEAMACGLPVITTRFGTEDYALADETAELVEAKDPKSIADALVKLITNDTYRYQIAKGGHVMSKKFTWEKSIRVMESILLRENCS